MDTVLNESSVQLGLILHWPGWAFAKRRRVLSDIIFEGNYVTLLDCNEKACKGRDYCMRQHPPVLGPQDSCRAAGGPEQKLV